MDSKDLKKISLLYEDLAGKEMPQYGSQAPISSSVMGTETLRSGYVDVPESGEQEKDDEDQVGEKPWERLIDDIKDTIGKIENRIKADEIDDADLSLKESVWGTLLNVGKEVGRNVAAAGLTYGANISDTSSSPFAKFAGSAIDAASQLFKDKSEYVIDKDHPAAKNDTIFTEDGFFAKVKQNINGDDYRVDLINIENPTQLPEYAAVNITNTRTRRKNWDIVFQDEIKKDDSGRYYVGEDRYKSYLNKVGEHYFFYNNVPIGKNYMPNLRWKKYNKDKKNKYTPEGGVSDIDVKDTTPAPTPTPTATKPKIGEAFVYNGTKYIFAGSWTYPKKSDDTLPGAIAPKDLQKEIMDAWLKSK